MGIEFHVSPGKNENDVDKEIEFKKVESKGYFDDLTDPDNGIFFELKKDFGVGSISSGFSLNYPDFNTFVKQNYWTYISVEN